MAQNYPGLRQLQHHPHRSGFDMSQHAPFSAKAGELLPVYVDIALPSTSYRINLQHFTRTQPLQTSAFVRLVEHFDVYEVPLNLLWKSSDISLLQMGSVNPIQSTSINEVLKPESDQPALSLSFFEKLLQTLCPKTRPAGGVQSFYENEYGFSRGALTLKLLQYLGYGNVFSSMQNVEDFFAGMKVADPSVDVDTSSLKYDYVYARNYSVLLYPILAYQKIYNDFYRNTQWEYTDPNTFNVDWYSGHGQIFASDDKTFEALYGFSSSVPTPSLGASPYACMFDLRYALWNRDLFMGVQPHTQFGEVASIESAIGASGALSLQSFRGSSSHDNLHTAFSFFDNNGISSTNYTGDGSSPNAVVSVVPTKGQSVTGLKVSLSGSSQFASGDSALLVPNSTYLAQNLRIPVSEAEKLSSSFNVLQLRMATALQRYREIQESNHYDVQSQMKSQFGYKPSDAYSNRCIYRGGYSSSLDISEVVNNNITSDNVATIAGKGVGVGRGQIEFKSTGYSVVMVLYHIVPMLNYNTGAPNSQFLATNAMDFPIPALDNVGMEPVSFYEFSNNKYIFGQNSASLLGTGAINLGYQPRYYAWKTKPDVVRGVFTTSMRDWVAPVDSRFFDSTNILYNTSVSPDDVSADFYPSPGFFHVNPRILDSIFGVAANSWYDTDQFLVNFYCDSKVVQPLSRDGLPY